MVSIYWHSIGMTEADETFVAGVLRELAQNLKAEPIKLLISIKRLADKPDIAKHVDAILNDPSYTFSNCAGAIPYSFFKEGILKEGVPPKLLVYCRPDSQIANAARRENPSALYGATCGSFAAVYRLDYKVTIWHEALHLLGADDCYEQDNPRKKKPQCKLDGCIMEWNPPESTCENWPFLCDKNICLLQDLSKNCRENKKG